MRTDDFDYHLPSSAIAQTPVEPRDSARLLVLHRAGSRVHHRQVRDLPELLRPGDAIVVNDSRVIPARLIGTRSSGGSAEVFLLRKQADGAWQALVRPGRRLGVGSTVQVDDLTITIEGMGESGMRTVRLSDEARAMVLGRAPLPPYITTPLDNPDRYQTVYARDPGSAAAPTAGLHFTDDLLARLAEKGIQRHSVTLHVGLDTFRPVQEDNPAEHALHGEWCSLDAEAADSLNAVRAAGGRIFAIGTTATRTLETAARDDRTFAAWNGMTNKYILPGYTFRGIDGLLTNFHLPKSTLLMLVSAFAGRDRVLAAYRTALEAGYRFYSFGDAMIVLPGEDGV